MRLIDWSLYAILDRSAIRNRPIKQAAEEAIQGGASVIQLRNKAAHSDEFYQDAIEIKKVCQRYGIPLIINDRLDIALAVGAEGVHLGQQDIPHKIARRLLGRDSILGISIHSIEEFERAKTSEPDYFGVGTIFPSQTKAELATKGTGLVAAVRARTNKPLIAIGGLTPENLGPVIRAGADGVAVISSLWTAESIAARAQEFLQNIHDVTLTEL
ncbi:MAG: thiamine phosphate synthase [bacterium]